MILPGPGPGPAAGRRSKSVDPSRSRRGGCWIFGPRQETAGPFSAPPWRAAGPAPPAAALHAAFVRSTADLERSARRRGRPGGDAPRAPTAVTVRQCPRHGMPGGPCRDAP